MVTGPSRAFQHILSAPKTLRKATRSRHLANRATLAFYKIVLRRRSIAPTTSSGKVTFFGGYSAGATTCQFSLPPRRGKTMLARRLAAILPPLSSDEVLEVSAIWSVAGLLPRHG